MENIENDMMGKCQSLLNYVTVEAYKCHLREHGHLGYTIVSRREDESDKDFAKRCRLLRKQTKELEKALLELIKKEDVEANKKKNFPINISDIPIIKISDDEPIIDFTE